MSVRDMACLAWEKGLVKREQGEGGIVLIAAPLYTRFFISRAVEQFTQIKRNL